MRAAFLIVAAQLLVPISRAQAQTDSVWFLRRFAQYDLTGDGLPDTLTLRATGKRVDGLLVELRIRSQGQLLFRDTWSSASYFQYDGPLDSIPGATKRTQVFRHLREVLVPSAFGRFQAGGQPGPDIETMSFYLALQTATDSLRRSGMREDALLRSAHRIAGETRPDTAVLERAWRGLVARRPRTFTYFSGGESTHEIVWSGVLGKFVTVFACC